MLRSKRMAQESNNITGFSHGTSRCQSPLIHPVQHLVSWHRRRAAEINTQRSGNSDVTLRWILAVRT